MTKMTKMMMVLLSATTAAAFSFQSLKTQGVRQLQTTKPRTTRLQFAVEPAEMLRERAKELREEAAALENDLAAEQREKREEELDAFFVAADTNGDGVVTLEELKAALKTKFVEQSSSERAKRRAEALVESEARVAALLKDLDVNADGVLTRAEMTLGVDAMRARLEKSFSDERDVFMLQKQQSEAATLVESRLEAYEAGANRTDVSVRLVSAAMYLLPFLDALPYSAPPAGLPDGSVEAVGATLTSILALYRAIPFSGVLALVALNFVASNVSAARLTRFSARHAILLDLCAVFALPLYAFLQPDTSFVPGTLLEGAVLFSTVLAAVFATKADFLPGTGRLAGKYVQNFDASVKAFLASATAAEVSDSALDIFGSAENDDEKAKKNDDDDTSPSSD